MELYNKLKSAPFIISGPCVIESEDMVMRLAEQIAEICERQHLTYIFKASFDKANRTSISSFRGPGLEEGLRILEKVKTQFNLPITTDVHESCQAAPLAEVIDILQIPAFLCRQTDLLVACAKTDKIVNIKKAQFLSGKDMVYPAQKVIDSGNNKVMLTERGTLMGYGDLVVDIRNLVDMKNLGYPVVMDVTHSTQKPGGLGGRSGGNREYAPYIAAAAKAVGVDGFFFEVHEDPDHALSDGPNMIPLHQFEDVLKKLK
ncbi:3-deoxy-8-phosphooctulonate synthase [Persicobacter psychrovividus]|uniref:3-deoxy-8-phosphooctulonate synthase n=1 Tax=Persicobacter psychrovividus TaxID=387638 RepID=A0ABM7VC83_9BACT|nr:2-dehydro-3-deoxyphosphooctonate aldolase [Persicobacter psychrovividus]